MNRLESVPERVSVTLLPSASLVATSITAVAPSRTLGAVPLEKVGAVFTGPELLPVLSASRAAATKATSLPQEAINAQIKTKLSLIFINYSP